MAELGFRAQIWTSCTNVLVGLEAPGLRDQLLADLPSAPAAAWPAASTVLVSALAVCLSLLSWASMSIGLAVFLRVC